MINKFTQMILYLAAFHPTNCGVGTAHSNPCNLRACEAGTKDPYKNVLEYHIVSLN